MVGVRGRLIVVSRDVASGTVTAEPRGTGFSRTISIERFGLSVRLRLNFRLLLEGSFGGFWDGALAGHVR